ncbi:MAG TPA: sulfate ABC transporter permease subunit [Polyangiales bacterium]
MLERASGAVAARAASSERASSAEAQPTHLRWAHLQPIGRAALVGLVCLYLGAILIGPLAALGVELAHVGIPAALHALAQPDAISALKMSIELTAISVVVNTVVGTLGALAIVRQRFFGRAVVNALADLPLAISPVMIGLAFVLLLGRDGWLSPLIDRIGLKVVFSFPGLVIATLFVALPYTLREVVYVLEEIGTNEEEAAATLGASAWQIFWRVTLPNIRFGLGYGVLMALARSLGEFGAVLVLGGSISGQTQTATTFIHDAIEERQTAGAYGMAVVLALSSVLLLLGLEWAKRHKKVR